LPRSTVGLDTVPGLDRVEVAERDQAAQPQLLGQQRGGAVVAAVGDEGASGTHAIGGLWHDLGDRKIAGRIGARIFEGCAVRGRLHGGPSSLASGSDVTVP
jgi:hypothetical protein